MSIPSRNSGSETWNEYKRLVLAELERLNDCVEKLRDQNSRIISGHDRDVAKKTAEIIAKTNARIKDLEASIQREFYKETETIKLRIQNLEGEAKENNVKEYKTSSMSFWTAIITIIATFVTSVISLIISLYGK